MPEMSLRCFPFSPGVIQSKNGKRCEYPRVLQSFSASLDKHEILIFCDQHGGAQNCSRNNLVSRMKPSTIATHATSSSGGVVQWKKLAIFAGVK